MLVTTVDEAWRSRDRGRGAQLPFFARHWACLFGLAASDILSFLLAAVFFRAWHVEPTIFIGRNGASSTTGTAIDVFAILAVLFVCLRAFAGDYSRREPFWDSLRGTLAALFVTSLPDLLAVALDPRQYSVWGAVCSWLFLILAVPALRQAARAGLARLGLWTRRTALIGNGVAVENAYYTLHKSLSLGFDIRWAVSIGPGMQPPSRLTSLKRIVCANADDAALLVQAAGCDQAILAMSEPQHQAFPELMRRLSEANIETAIVPALPRLPLGNLKTSVLFGRNVLLFQVRDNLRRSPQRIFKRVFDLVCASMGIIILSPLFVALAALVKWQDGGAATYSQTRIGREGRPFPCIKFRTMSLDADERMARWKVENAPLYEEYLRTYKLRDDPRVTPLGNWLRRTSLDELPQLVNILRGEMTFVGPRPVVERELVEFYGPAAQLYMRVRPGLTGLWQVSGRGDTTYEERIAFDEWYILNWSIWYDLVILVQTFGAMVSGHGAF